MQPVVWQAVSTPSHAQRREQTVVPQPLEWHAGHALQHRARHHVAHVRICVGTHRGRRRFEEHRAHRLRALLVSRSIDTEGCPHTAIEISLQPRAVPQQLLERHRGQPVGHAGVTEDVAQRGAPGELAALHGDRRHRRGHRLATRGEVPPILEAHPGVRTQLAQPRRPLEHHATIAPLERGDRHQPRIQPNRLHLGRHVERWSGPCVLNRAGIETARVERSRIHPPRIGHACVGGDPFRGAACRECHRQHHRQDSHGRCPPVRRRSTARLDSP